MKPKRIKLSRTRGWRKPENTVVVSRPSKWGNPFVVRRYTGYDLIPGRQWEVYDALTLVDNSDSMLMDSCSSRDEAIKCAIGRFERALSAGKLLVSVDEVRLHLAGRNLACWCPVGSPCHADVLLRVANGCEP